jgi:hypothetical protein
MKVLCILVLILLLYEVNTVRNKHPTHRFHPTVQTAQNRTKCIFYIKKGCKLSKKIYVDGKREIERRLKNNNGTLFTYSNVIEPEVLPICDRNNFDITLYEPVYTVNETDRARIIATMVGAYDNSTEVLITTYNTFLKQMCASNDRFQHTSFLNMLKILTCALYDAKDGFLSHPFVVNTITNYLNTLATPNLFNGNIKKIEDSIVFNPALMKQIAETTSVFEIGNVLPMTMPHVQSLKKTMDEEEGFVRLKSYVKNAHKLYSTVGNMSMNTKDEQFMIRFRREFNKKKDSIARSYSRLKSIFGGIPGILNDKVLKNKITQLTNEVYFTSSKASSYFESVKNAMYHGHREYIKHENHTENSWVQNSSIKFDGWLHRKLHGWFGGLYGGIVKKMGSYERTAEQQVHYLHAMNTHLINTRKDREHLHNTERKYYEGRTVVYNKHAAKYNWKDEYYDENTNILNWRGFVVGGKDPDGDPITNVFNIESISDDFWGAFWVVSYLYNPFFNVLGINNTIFNETTCTPTPPKLPDPRLGCVYPHFEAVPTGGAFFGLFPVGFDFANPNCEDYTYFGGWSLGIIRVAGTYFLGNFVLREPKLSKFIGFDYLVLNATGGQGLAALPSNMIPCLIIFTPGYIILFALVVFASILVLILGIILVGRVEIRYLTDKKKRKELRKLYSQDYEQHLATTTKRALSTELREKIQEGVLVGKSYDLVPDLDPTLKLQFDKYLSQYLKN